MAGGEGQLAVEGGGDGDGEHLGQFLDFAPSLGGDDAAASDDHGALGLGDDAGCFTDTVALGLGTEGREGGVKLLHDDLEVGFVGAGVIGDVEVHGAGGPGGGIAEGLAQGVGEAAHLVDENTGLGDGLVPRGVLIFLVGVAVAVLAGEAPVMAMTGEWPM